MTTAEQSTHRADVATRLLDSSDQLSYDPLQEVDWDGEVDPRHHGASPEWSTLFGTAYWDEMTEEQRAALTRQEAASVASTGIWFEMILQQMVLRDQYAADPADPELRFALTEIGDECRHSIMFARACETMGIHPSVPPRGALELGRFFKTVASAESAYGGILVAEEVLDVMQRDWMRGEDVLPLVREASRIHVVEESRHMKFARQEIRENMAGTGRTRRHLSAWLIAASAHVIVTNMVGDGVYAAAGLDPDRALREARHNEHHHAMLRSSCAHLIDFLGQVGLLTRPATRIYQRAHLL